ncbi:MAG: response regulator transcription factor [Myxococcales bacterium]|jgi:DNA-binding NarL/FixJ family response regulator|nr:response regulator transcription factor [Myxococcales bacterium]
MEQGAQDVWVLLVEDSETDAKLLVRELQACGLAPHCERVETAVALRGALAEREWSLVISDSSMPGFDAIAALGVTQELRPGTPFIVVSGSMREETAVAALRSGAADFITKDNLHRLGAAVTRELSRTSKAEPSTALLEVVDRRLAQAELCGGERCVVEIRVARALLAQALSDASAPIPSSPARDPAAARADAPRPAPAARSSNITARQMGVLELIARGHSTREIAERLELSVKTVESHRAQLLLRLGVRGVAGLVRHAIRIGLVGVDD